jgi:hypothetical protein
MRFATGLSDAQEVLDDFLLDNSYIFEFQAQKGNKNLKNLLLRPDGSLEYLR